MTALDVFTILTTGSRRHTDANLIGTRLYEAIDATAAERIVIRHGACPGTPKRPGADRIVSEFCASEAEHFERSGRLLIEDPVPAEWDLCGRDCPDSPHRVVKKPGDVYHPGTLPDYCPGAGPRRNARMVGLGADACLAFPLGASYGTYGCMRLARRAGIPTRRFLPEADATSVARPRNTP